MPKATHYTVVVIGTGFGGAMTALPIAREMVRRNKGEKHSYVGARDLVDHLCGYRAGQGSCNV